MLVNRGTRVIVSGPIVDIIIICVIETSQKIDNDENKRREPFMAARRLFKMTILPEFSIRYSSVPDQVPVKTSKDKAHNGVECGTHHVV